MKRLWILTVLVLSSYATANANAATVAEVANAKSPAFGAALQSSGLGAMLKGAGPFTLLVPTDEAFAKLGDKFKNDPERLKAVLTMHIVPGKVTAAEMKERANAKTVNGKALKVSAEDGKFEIGNAKVLQADIAASNGLVDTIDAVLMP
jgi:uncharacterized surface protein with fasciclin (FAS1) repeats